jgi:hypothetical protein
MNINDQERACAAYDIIAFQTLMLILAITGLVVGVLLS